MKTIDSTTAGAMRVILSGDGEWRGTLVEFLQTNDWLSAEEVTDIVRTLQRGEPWVTGGGAAALQVLRREPPRIEILPGGRFTFNGVAYSDGTETAQNIADRVRILGAYVDQNVTRNTCALVVGAHAGTRLFKAQALGIPIIYVEDFVVMLERTESERTRP